MVENRTKKIIDSKIEKAVTLARGGVPTKDLPEGEIGNKYKASKILYQAMVKMAGGYTHISNSNGTSSNFQDYNSQ